MQHMDVTGASDDVDVAYAFVRWREHTSHTSPFECRSIGRSITDTGCLWIDLNTGLRINHLPPSIFHQYGIVDVEWRLSGHVCGPI